MIVKWRRNVLRFGGKKLRFSEDILAAGEFENWVAVCTPCRMYFYGDEHMVLTRPIRNAVVREDGVYYHHRESNQIFVVANPFEPEEFVFFQHGYFLKEIVSDVLVLEKNGEYLLRNINVGRGGVYNGFEAPLRDENEANVLDRQLSGFSKTRTLGMYETDGELRCLIDDCDYGGGLSVQMAEYEGFLVGMHRSAALFVKIGGSRGGVKRSKLPSGRNAVFDCEIEHFAKYRMRLSKDVCLEFLRINERLFLGNDVVCSAIDARMWPGSAVSGSWRQNYHRPFWRGISRLERNILACCSRSAQKDFIEAFLRHGEKRFDVLSPTKDVTAKINKVLERWLVRSGDVWRFLSLGFPPLVFPLVQSCERLIRYTHPGLAGTGDSMDVKYKRLVEYNRETVKSMRYSEINNLAYKIIYLELKKDETRRRTRPVRSVKRLCKAAEWFFGDPRMEEIFSLFNERPRVFEIDENDLENRKEKSYILRAAANVGRAYLFFGLDAVRERYRIAPLKFLIYKNDELGEIEIKESGWADWPTFNHAVYRSCALAPGDEVSHSFVEKKIMDFASSGAGSEFALAGCVFGFGLQGRLSEIHPQTLLRLVSSKHPAVSMALLAGMGISHIGRRDEVLGKLYIYYLKSVQPLYIHVGSIVGLGMLYSGSSNALVRDVLVHEADKDGVFRCETYNKGNKIWYDYAYRVSASLSVAMLYVGTNLEMYKFAAMKDSLCELLANGVVLFGTKQMRFASRLKRMDSDCLEELFYSEFFLLGLLSDGDADEIARAVCESYSRAKLCELYRMSGRILYLGVHALCRDSVDADGPVFRMILDVCLGAERLMGESDGFKVLFDTCIIALSLMSSSTCNLEVVRILRRQIRRMEKSKFLVDQTDFFCTTSRCKQETQFTMRYGDIERYKLCLGVAACGMGSLRISNSPRLVLDVVATFFVNFPLSPMDQEYFNMFRYFLLLSTQSEDGFRSSMAYLKLSSRRSRNRETADMARVNRMFAKGYSEASAADRKFIVDVLTDFYEQYGCENTLLDVEMLKNVACRSI